MKTIEIAAMIGAFDARGTLPTPGTYVTATVSPTPRGWRAHGGRVPRSSASSTASTSARSPPSPATARTCGMGVNEGGQGLHWLRAAVEPHDGSWRSKWPRRARRRRAATSRQRGVVSVRVSARATVVSRDVFVP